MHTFTYPVLARFLYKFGNIPATLILVIYLYASVEAVDKHFLNIILVIVLITLIYLLNRHYFNLYKILPYKIETDGEKITGTDFLFSGKKMVIYFNNISDLKGGIFDGRLSGVMKIYDSTTKFQMGFFSKLKDADQFEKLLLSKINRPVYDSIVQRVGIKSGIKPGK